MQKCSNSSCGRCISTTHRNSYVTAEVAGVTQYWCHGECFKAWEDQNLVFITSADPFAARRRTNSESRRKHY